MSELKEWIQAIREEYPGRSIVLVTGKQEQEVVKTPWSVSIKISPTQRLVGYDCVGVTPPVGEVIHKGYGMKREGEDCWAFPIPDLDGIFYLAPNTRTVAPFCPPHSLSVLSKFPDMHYIIRKYIPPLKETAKYLKDTYGAKRLQGFLVNHGGDKSDITRLFMGWYKTESEARYMCQKYKGYIAFTAEPEEKLMPSHITNRMYADQIVCASLGKRQLVLVKNPQSMPDLLQFLKLKPESVQDFDLDQ